MVAYRIILPIHTPVKPLKKDTPTSPSVATPWKSKIHYGAPKQTNQPPSAHSPHTPRPPWLIIFPGIPTLAQAPLQPRLCSSVCVSPKSTNPRKKGRGEENPQKRKTSSFYPQLSLRHTISFFSASSSRPLRLPFLCACFGFRTGQETCGCFCWRLKVK